MLTHCLQSAGASTRINSSVRRAEFIFHSPLAPKQAIEALRAGADEEHWAFSFSGYEGDLPVVGKFREERFRLRKRIYYNNAFARQFYGELLPEPNGTRVQGYFASNLSTRIFAWVWFLPVIWVCLRILFKSGSDLLRGGFLADQRLFGGLIPFGILAGGLLIVFVGRLLSRGGERFIVEHVQDTLNASVEKC